MTYGEIRRVLDQAQRDLTSWYLASLLDETDAAERLGYVFYDNLAAALGAAPDSPALALIAHLLVDKGEHVEKARAEVEALNGMYKGEVPA